MIRENSVITKREERAGELEDEVSSSPVCVE